MRAAVFLDRDGTIVQDVHFLRRKEDVRLLAGAAEGIAALNAAGFLVVVVSNQSGVARGLVSEAGVREIHDAVAAELRGRGARVDAFYYCPHGPDDRCACRKPRPGMFHRAARELAIDLAASYAAGDMARDLEAARNAGVRAAVLVRSGRCESAPGLAAHVADDLAVAARWILDDSDDRREGSAGDRRR
jgi:D-glycero-D-manno-heptose 1,7-bisphosphate phosphatase